jgi:hypothetical protein
VQLLTQRGHKAVALLDALAQAQVGERLRMHLDMNRVHFFEPGETGPSLLHESGKLGPGR